MKKTGFTLLEILIVLVIISILSLLIYPTYSGYLVKTHRTYAIAALWDLAAKIEEYRIINNTYNGATLEKLHINTSNYRDYYNLSLSANADVYTLRATPVGKQAKNDVLCGSLVLDQDGNRHIDGSGEVNECWLF